MKSLLVLAYNEENKIRNVIEDYIDLFDEIIVIDDASKDETKKIIENLNSSKIRLIRNKKNLGAGKSFELGINEFLQSKSKFLIKVDGDSQFLKRDVIKMIDLFENRKADYIKGDRFWESGVEGNIPLIRYIGNSFASLLIKLSTGNWKINDPLNGLIGFSKDGIKNFKLPKLFKRYGYPFYCAVHILSQSHQENLKIIQFQNTIVYKDEKSNLKPIGMFFKLIIFTLFSYFTKIKIKLKNSSLQMSALLDLLFVYLFSSFIYSFITFIRVRYFLFSGDESNWFVVTILFLSISLITFSFSQVSENKFLLQKFEEH